MKKKYINCLLYEVGREPICISLRNALKDLQEVVGGNIEVVPLRGTNNLLVCNEEGLILNLEANRAVYNQFIYGDFFICGRDGEDFGDVDLDAVPELPIPYWQTVRGGVRHG